MTKEQSFNLIVQVVLKRATGTSEEIDVWKEALIELKKLLEPVKAVKVEKNTTNKKVI